MRVTPFLTVALLASAVLAGCADPPAPAATPEAVEPEPTLHTMEAEFQFHLGAAVGTPVVGVNVPLGTGPNYATFDVPENATALAIDVSWTCSTGPACGLDLVVFRGERAVLSESATSPARLEMDQPDEGRYRVAAYPSREGAAVFDAQGTFGVTLSYLAVAEDAGEAQGSGASATQSSG